MKTVIENEKILEIIKINNECLLDLTSNDLKVKINSLITTLQWASKNLDNKEYKKINSLGIIQRQGQEIDILCAKLHELVRVNEELSGK